VTLSDAEIMDELDSWGRFAAALRADDRVLFREMLSLCYDYFPAMQAKESPFASEALFMAILLAQHKTIAWLAAEVDRLKGARTDARLDT
jgi:hypothetical protein